MRRGNQPPEHLPHDQVPHTSGKRILRSVGDQLQHQTQVCYS